MIELERFRGAMPIKQYASSTNILFFGRLVERKGCRQLLKTVNRLQRDGRLSEDIRVLVCGTGPQERALKDYVRRNHLDPLVTFTGFVAEADKAKYLAAGDVIVYPSTGGESFGIVLLEGMAAGRGIVLAGDNPGYRGVLAEHPEALFDPNNETMFAARIQTALDGPARRMAARQWQQRFVRRFDIPQAGKAIVAVYDAALHKHQR
jgi:phosphatidylinositol alpha-mannosyltransferase